MAGFRDYGLNFKKNGNQPISADANHLALSATNDYTLHLTNASGGYAHLHVQDLYVDGVANVSAGFWNIDYANIDYTLSVSGDATFGSNVYIDDNITVGGSSYISGNSSLVGDSLINGKLDVRGNVSGASNLIIDLNSTIRGNETVSGNFRVGGNTRLDGTADITGNVNIGSNVYINGTELVNGDLSTNSNFRASLNSTISGNETIGGNLLVNGSSRVLTNSSVVGNVGISGTAQINQTLVVDGNISGQSNLWIDDNAIIEGNVGISGNQYVSGDEFIDGDITVAGNVYVSGLIIQGSASSADVYLNNNLVVSQNVTVSGDTFIGSNLNVEGDTEIDGTLTIHTDIVVDGNATIQGIVNFDSLGTLDNDFHVGQDLYAHDDLYVEDFAEVSGALHIINYTKNNSNGLHRNENSGGVTSEPGFVPYHSILWIEGNPISGNYLGHFYNESISGGFVKYENNLGNIVLSNEQSLNGDGLLYVNNKFGQHILTTSGDQTENYQVSLSGNFEIYGDIKCDSIDYHYWGDQNTDGSWRLGVISGNFVVEKRVSGNWITKHTFI
jgi:predicted acyltransferase (DUF342 family)